MLSLTDRLRRRVANGDVHHRRIASAFLVVGIFLLIARAAGAAKEMAVAWRYGIGHTVDAYVFIFNLVTWPVSVWLSVLTVVMVPLCASLRRECPNAQRVFDAELLGVTLVLGTVLGFLMFGGLSVLLYFGHVHLAPEGIKAAKEMAGLLVFLVPLGFLISLFSARVIASGGHRNTLIEAVPPATIMLAILIPLGGGYIPLVWGTLAGFGLQLTALAWILMRRGLNVAPALRLSSPVWRDFGWGIGIMCAGQLLTSLAGVVDQFFAADLGAGAVSTLNYANRVLGLLLSLGAMGIGRATLPIFSEASAHQRDKAYSLANTWARWMFFAGAIVAVCTAAGSEYVVRVLFERGAFTSNDTTTVARVLAFSVVQIPLYFASLVLVSALASYRAYSVIALSGALNLVMKLLFNWLLVREFQLVGVVLASGGMYLVSLVVLVAAVRHLRRPVGKSAQ